MFDVVFSGFGTSTCLLIMEMEKQGLLDGKKCLVIDPSTKIDNDKTFCFWARESDEIVKALKHIISHQWDKIQIDNNPASSISPLHYFHIRSIDLFNEVKKILQKHKIQHLTASITEIVKDNHLKIKTTENQNYSANWVFDSRPPDLSSIQKSTSFLYQSFIGYKIKLISSGFEDSVYRMMDFRVPQGGATQFIYVLPYSETTGLVEMTRFGKEKIIESEAGQDLNEYIRINYGKFELLDIEKGVIPMSPSIPRLPEIEGWVMIGTKAGNVKPSTGFAFKNMFQQAKEICKNDQLNHVGVKLKSRFLFYDQLLLIILSLWPKMGKPIFQRLFSVKNPGFVLRFLEEKTNPFEEVNLFSKLQIFTFLKALTFWGFMESKRFQSIAAILVLSLLYLFLGKISSLPIENMGFGILIIGLFLVGIPHGALDNLVGRLSNKNQNIWKFSIVYIILMIPVFILWYVLPLAGLLFFLLYSAWHFGQSDMAQWKINHPISGIIWGALFLGFLLLSHQNEFNQVLFFLHISPLEESLVWNYLALLFLMISLGLAGFHKSKEWFFMLIFMALSAFIPLIISFGFYFVFYHSWNGWCHLKKELLLSNQKLYLYALPFNLGAFLIFGLAFLKLDQAFLGNVSYFFVFLSCISFPHILFMHRFYQQTVK